MPFGLDTKYPNAGKQWPWFWLFPAAGLSTDPRTKVVRRHHEGDHVIQRAMKDAVTAAAITKPATPPDRSRRFPPFAAERRLASLEPPAHSRTRDAEIPEENSCPLHILFAKDTANAQLPSVNTHFSQRKATRRDQSRPVAD